MVFHPSHRPLEIATRFPQFHSPDDDDISPTNKKHKGTLLSSYRGGHFYWALTPFLHPEEAAEAGPIEPPSLPLMGADPPLRRQFRRHPSELPSSVLRFRIRQVACYPPGTGNAQIRPSISLRLAGSQPGASR